MTAAVGASAYAGIPLTHRDHAQACVFVTGHGKDGAIDLDWASLIQPRQTVAVYMGLRNLEPLTGAFVANGASPDLPAAIVDNATRLEPAGRGRDPRDVGKGSPRCGIARPVDRDPRLRRRITRETRLVCACVSRGGTRRAYVLVTSRTAGANTGETVMTYEFAGRTIETTSTGYLVDLDDWSRELAEHMASLEHIELTRRHWDVIDHLRDEYFNNNQSTPNTRAILKAMSERWGEKIEQKALYELFPLDPSKQGGRIAGLPESKRKGGY